MLRSILLLLPAFLLLTLFSCGPAQTGTTVEGTIEGAAGLDAFLDRVQINGANEILTKTPIDNNGAFSLNFPEGLEPGIYQLRIGAQRAPLALSSEDKTLTVTGSLTSFPNYGYTVAGSESSEELRSTLQSLNGSPQTLQSLGESIAATSDPRIGAFIAFNALSRAGAQGLPIHQAALARLDDSNPEKATYAQFVQQLEAQVAAQRSAERIQVGQPAPNISLPSPEGKTYELEDLKGQVVLIDFWASWCGPCRRENPNVVKVYDKYKDQGFTIYSVSLDGLDPRRTAGMSPEQIARGQEGQKKRWTDAIAKDNLKWPYHVSELAKWNTKAAAEYGVRGIPKTFLIDREGKIAAVGLRGAASIEQALQEVL